MADPIELAFSAEGLCVGFDRSPLLSDVRISLPRGQILTLIGPNGAGKSTLLKSITRHLTPLAGTVLIGRDDVRAMSPSALARRLSVVLTERIDPELMTCREVAATGRYPYTGAFGLLSPRDHEIVEKCLAQVHASELADMPFAHTSDGQRQRVMLARALCQEPEVIVLDEPTSFLDVRHKTELLGLLLDMARRGITVIMSLHEIDLAEKVSDLVMCVREDRTVECGRSAEMFSEEKIRALYGLRRGAYLPLSGSVELPPPAGEAQVFVVGGGGFGVPFYRALCRARTPFAAGILQENDADFSVARALGSQVFSAPAFCAPDQDTLDRAVRALLACRAVIHTGVPILPGNAWQDTLLRAAREHDLPIRRELS